MKSKLDVYLFNSLANQGDVLLNRNAQQTPKFPDTRAQSMLEFALIIPVILLLVLGTLDFGRIISTRICMENAAREGVNYLVSNPTDMATGFVGTYSVIKAEGEIQNYTIMDDDITIDNCCTIGQPVSVTVSTSLDLVFGGFLSTLGIAESPFDVSSTITMMAQGNN